MEPKDRRIYLAVFGVLFVFLFVFFSRIHPVLMLDGDDWSYIAFAREALPAVGAWNPARVLPEILMPAVGAVAAHLVTPLLGDYLKAITVTYAFVIALVILVYLICFSRFLTKVCRLGAVQNVTVTALFLAVHFWVFRSGSTENSYLFHARNLTCYFFYTIPTLLCAILVLLFEADPKIWDRASVTGKGVLLLAAYLAVYSNVFCSIVIAAYAGVVLLQKLLEKGAGKGFFKKLWEVLKENAFFTGTVLAWLASFLFELTGGRADSVEQGREDGSSVFSALAESLGSMNKHFGLFVVAGCVFAAAVLIRSLRKKKAGNVTFYGARFFRFAAAAAVTAVYQLLLCGITGLDHYLLCGDVLITVFFYAFMALFTVLLYVLAEVPKAGALLPLALCVAVSFCNTKEDTFQESNYYDGPSAVTASVTEDVYRQVVDASAQGLTQVVVKVPVFDDPYNWPLSPYMESIVARSLYEHGQLAWPMEITIVPDPQRNELFGMELPAPVK